MKKVFSITAECRDLLEGSSIPAIYKSVIRDKYDNIDQLLTGDEYTAMRGEFVGLAGFQRMLQHAQVLKDRPAQANAFADLLQSSNALIQFLHGTCH